MNFQEYGYDQSERSMYNFMYKVYGWMSAGLAMTAAIGFYIYKNPEILKAFSSSWAIFGIIFLQLILVIVLSAFVLKMSYPVSVMMFLFYAATVGITLSFLLSVYTTKSVFSTFLVTSGMFMLTCVYGYVTKKDLTSLGSFGMMALFGLILTGIVNIFLRSNVIDVVSSIIGVVVFVALTAYDSQNIKEIGRKLMFNPEARKRISIVGALTLYLDFINLFLYLLRFMGVKKND